MNVIVVTPCGRKRYLEILLENLKKNKEHFQQWHLWVNTDETEDREYCNELALEYDWIRLIVRPNVSYHVWNNIYQFWKYYQKEDTVYVRIDDDVVYLEKDFIKKITEFTANNPQFIITYGNINNNGIISHIHQKLNAFEFEHHITYNPFNELYYGVGAYTCSQIAHHIHCEFIKNVLEDKKEKYYFPQWNIEWFRPGQRIFINAVCWLGGNFKNYNVDIPPDEELYVTTILPEQLQMSSSICGTALCSHLAFGPQRLDGLDELSLLEGYKQIQHL